MVIEYSDPSKIDKKSLPTEQRNTVNKTVIVKTRIEKLKTIKKLTIPQEFTPRNNDVPVIMQTEAKRTIGNALTTDSI